MRAILIAAAFACATVAAAPAFAGWQDTASAFDQDRLSHLEDAKARALGEAAAGPDMDTLRAVLDPAAMPAPADALTGAWRCRTLKLGGMTPSVVYSWFRCRISERGGHLYLEKLTGSQRTRGWLYANGDGTFVYLGASSAGREPPHNYSGNGAGAGAGATPDDQIGLLSMIAAGHARLEMPYPVQESTLDVLELKR
ncbi:MAG TPA: DUF4893 domain-containing protein [Rhizomicrobium sp.]|nr:DUF4893 domain-containing protein [Rhizomicrobium sp.]